MSTNDAERDLAPADEVHNSDEYDGNAETHFEDGTPKFKSNHSRRDANSVHPPPRFALKEQVHMAIQVGNQKQKGSFTVYSSRYNPRAGHNEYQLMIPASETLYGDGQYYRERDVKKGP